MSHSTVLGPAEIRRFCFVAAFALIAAAVGLERNAGREFAEANRDGSSFSAATVSSRAEASRESALRRLANRRRAEFEAPAQDARAASPYGSL